MARTCIPDRRFAIILLALALSSASAVPPEREAYRKAATLCDYGDWRAAEPFLRGALAQFGTSDSDDVWEMRLLLGDTLTALSRYQAAEDVLTPEPPPRLAKSGIAVRRLLEQAVLKYRLQRVPDSIRLLRKAEAIARAHQPRLLADVFGRWAVIETARHEYASAERYAGASIRRARADHDRVFEINALGTLARLRTFRGHYDEAVDLNRRALRLANAAGTRSKIEKVSGNLGWTFILLGDFDAASDYLATALATAESIGAEYDLVPWLHNLGDIALHNRDYATALSYYQRGVVVARRIGHRDLGEFVANTSVALLNLGDVAGARKANDEVRGLLGDQGDAEQQLRSLMIDARIDAKSGQLDSAIVKMRRVIDAAETRSQRWEAHGRLAQFYVGANQPLKADEEFRLAIDTAAAARQDVKNEELRLPFGALVREIHEEYVAFLLGEGKVDKALEAAELSRARTLEEALDEAPGVQTIDLKRVAQEHGAVILAYWLAPARSYVWTITSTSISVDVLKSSGEIESAVERYAGELTGPMAGSGSAPQGEKLYAMLLPAAARRLRGGQRVIVIPDGRLHAFNMETLVDPSHHYWIEDVTLETASSIDLLSRPRSEDASKSMLIIGDPPSPDPQFPRLAHAAEEVTRIQQQFKSCVVLTGAAATPSAYARATPERYGIVHFVAHGVATRLRPLESAVILAREGESYKLYARDIVKKPLRARLVTISSCHGAGTRAYTGEGLVGLAWAFLHAGARQVIAALWEVNDSATPGLMSDLYAGIRHGDDPAVALRAAKLKLVRGTNVYRLPHYWAPFVLYSGS